MAQSKLLRLERIEVDGLFRVYDHRIGTERRRLVQRLPSSDQPATDMAHLITENLEVFSLQSMPPQGLFMIFQRIKPVRCDRTSHLFSRRV